MLWPCCVEYKCSYGSKECFLYLYVYMYIYIALVSSENDTTNPPGEIKSIQGHAGQGGLTFAYVN